MSEAELVGGGEGVSIINSTQKVSSRVLKSRNMMSVARTSLHVGRAFVNVFARPRGLSISRFYLASSSLAVLPFLSISFYLVSIDGQCLLHGLIGPLLWGPTRQQLGSEI